MSYIRRFRTFWSTSSMQRIGFIVSRGTSGMGFAAVSVFEVANILKGEDIYDIHFLSEGGGSIPTSVGMRVETEPFGNIPLDTLNIRRFRTFWSTSSMQRIGFIVSRGTSGMGFAAVSVFEVANILKGEDIYDVHFLSEGGGSIPTSVGMRV